MAFFRHIGCVPCRAPFYLTLTPSHPRSPCGGDENVVLNGPDDEWNTPVAPTFEVKSGEDVVIAWQKNANHFNGSASLFELSYSLSSNPSSDGFIDIATIDDADVGPNNMDYVWDTTAVPATAHGVLRVVYVTGSHNVDANNLGGVAATYTACADIKISPGAVTVPRVALVVASFVVALAML